MLLNSKGLALVLAASIAIIIGVSLSLIPDLPDYIFWLIPIICFGTSYILINVVLEFLFFKELRNIYEMFEKIRNNDLATLKPKRSYGHSSLNQIQQEIYAYAHVKQSEIEELKQSGNNDSNCFNYIDEKRIDVDSNGNVWYEDFTEEGFKTLVNHFKSNKLEMDIRNQRLNINNYNESVIVLTSSNGNLK